MSQAYKTWSLHAVTASTTTDLITPASSLTSVLSVARFTNTGSVQGNLTLTRTDSSNNVLATILTTEPIAPNATFELRGLACLNPNKIRVYFDQSGLDCDVSGSEG
jgi:hypothetical protein